MKVAFIAFVLALTIQVAWAKTTAQKFADTLDRPAYFISAATGRIRLIQFGTDRSSPFSRRIRTVHLMLYDPHDEKIFIRLANRHTRLATAELREKGSPFSYILYGVYVKGYDYERPRSADSNVQIELGGSDWIPCGHDRNLNLPCP
jgi:hypothetical protein